jgi:hypothetical protein
VFGASIGRLGQRIIDAIVRWLAHGHINPNILTVIGVALNVGAECYSEWADSFPQASPWSWPTFRHA